MNHKLITEDDLIIDYIKHNYAGKYVVAVYPNDIDGLGLDLDKSYFAFAAKYCNVTHFNAEFIIFEFTTLEMALEFEAINCSPNDWAILTQVWGPANERLVKTSRSLNSNHPLNIGDMVMYNSLIEGDY